MIYKSVKPQLETCLQHFLNVLEIALQHGSSADFDNQAWKVARLYAEKVQNKIDKGDTWQGFQGSYGSDSHPHELKKNLLLNMSRRSGRMFRPNQRLKRRSPLDDPVQL